MTIEGMPDSVADAISEEQEIANRWYEVDEFDRIISVDPQWDAFAEANGGQSIGRHKVIGRSLLQFVTGDVSRMFIEVALKSARLKQQPRVLAYRCDAPGLKRAFEMTLIPFADGRVRVEHRLKSLEPSNLKTQYLYAPAFVNWLRCSQCLKVSSKDTGGAWRLPETVDFFQTTGVIRVQDTVCESCQANANSALQPWGLAYREPS